MANAGKKFGLGQQDQGKGDGSGGMGPADPEITPRTEILSNRDTSRHSDERGLDSRHVQNEQLQDREADQTGDAVPDSEELADERPTDDDAGTGGTPR